ncbi:MAG: GAF domain-containing protein [Propionibacteriaceae bacterium]
MHAHDAYLSSGQVEAPVRSLVLESWRRSLGAGVDPETSVAPLLLSPAELERLRADHPLAPTMPLIRRLLLDSVVEAGLLLALSDAAGRLLWVEGHSGLRSKAEGMLFVEGADWSESAVGTNAPGTALALDQAVQIFAAEHLSRPVTPWSCSAAPIHDPDTGAVMGVLDLTGGDQVASPQSLSLVRATVAAVESELRLERLQLRAVRDSRSTPRPLRPEAARLQVLGAHQAVLRSASRASSEVVTRLSPRHSEMLLLLLESADGMTTAELAVALSDRDAPEVTVRAELSRLRSALEPIELRSRPYRVAEPVDTDLAEVRRALAGGDHRRAVAAYRGPVLPFSEAPAVVELREDLHDRLRSGLLRSHDADALLRFADTAHGRDDVAVWQAALLSLPGASPRRVEVETHVRRLLARYR